MGDLVVVVSGQALTSLLLQLFNLLHDVGARLECFNNAFASEYCGYKLINGYIPGIRGVCATAAAAAVGCGRCC